MVYRTDLGRGRDWQRRVLFPLLAVGIATLTIIMAPGSVVECVAVGVAAGVFVVWSRVAIPTVLFTCVVEVLVVFSQLGGALEPAMFLLCLLALLVAGDPQWTKVAAVVALVLSAPVLVWWMSTQSEFAWGTWIVAIAFSALMGWAVQRQQRLAFRLEQTRRELLEQEALQQRRRIARDVHDLVGHALAGVMLQVSSARHVLRSDPDSAAEALAEAEGLGRSGLAELRNTVASLRDDDSAVEVPPGLAQIVELVDSARSGGLDVTYTEHGPQDGVDQAVGLALYRIAQESVANAAHHAESASTAVHVTAARREVSLEVRTTGALTPAASEQHGQYGLRGMYERANTVGGTLEAGPVPDGWLVRCRVPLAPGVPRQTTAARSSEASPAAEPRS